MYDVLASYKLIIQYERSTLTSRDNREQSTREKKNHMNTNSFEKKPKKPNTDKLIYSGSLYLPRLGKLYRIFNR